MLHQENGHIDNDVRCCISNWKYCSIIFPRHNFKNCECDLVIPQSQTADKPMAPRGRATQPHETPGRQTKQSNQLSSLPHQDDCKTKMDIK